MSVNIAFLTQCLYGWSPILGYERQAMCRGEIPYDEPIVFPKLSEWHTNLLNRGTFEEVRH
jgi:hypothetical protein